MGAGESCRRRAAVRDVADRSGGHDESIPAGSAVKVRGWAPRAKVSMTRMRPPQQGQTLDEAWGVEGLGSAAVSLAPTSVES